MIRLFFLLSLLSFNLYAKDVYLDKSLIPKNKDSFLNFAKEYLHEEAKSVMIGTSRWGSRYIFYYDEKIADSLYNLASSNELAVNKYKEERINIRGKINSIEVVNEGVVFVLGAFVGDNEGYILSLFDKPDKKMLQMSKGDKISVRCNILSSKSNAKFVVTNNCVFKEDHVNNVYNMLFNNIREDFKTNDVKVSYYLESEIAFVYKLYESKFEKICSNKHRCYEAINFIRNEKETPGYIKGSLNEKTIKFSEKNIEKYKKIIPNVN